jgi:hypothetical protein
MTYFQFPVRGCLQIQQVKYTINVSSGLHHFLTRIPLCSPDILFFLQVENTECKLNIMSWNTVIINMN